ncbi:hypothetical protein [Mesorhizobium sp. M0088]|uniref:hypothetical protein n=1 Tax=Mesorhizobium sp. M0088 TaxID=2956873 RepID=UPI00333D6144
MAASLKRPTLQKIGGFANAVDLFDLIFHPHFERHSGFHRTHGVHLRFARGSNYRIDKRAPLAVMQFT